MRTNSQEDRSTTGNQVDAPAGMDNVATDATPASISSRRRQENNLRSSRELRADIVVAQEVKIDGKAYWPVRRVSEESGYSSDYVAYLCRTDEIGAVRLGPNWLVEEESARQLVRQKRPQAAKNSDAEKWWWIEIVIHRLWKNRDNKR